ncbi:hypothetical protein H9L39_17454 [Fusarium oxysporum f. sp. albedinis]|nr:hypothetical protein H9L39_17454 [Fusarium oxysporum f. sp. albedinis]
MAHRVLIARKLKGLEDIISFSVVHWHLNFRTGKFPDKGWRFVTATDTDAEGENVVPDPLHDNFTHLRELYSETDPDFAARFSVPVLYNKVQQVIVNHESSEIRRRLGIEPVYAFHFRCNVRDIRSGYPHIHKWLLSFS